MVTNETLLLIRAENAYINELYEFERRVKEKFKQIDSQTGIEITNSTPYRIDFKVGKLKFYAYKFEGKIYIMLRRRWGESAVEIQKLSDIWNAVK